MEVVMDWDMDFKDQQIHELYVQLAAREATIYELNKQIEQLTEELKVTQRAAYLISRSKCEHEAA